MVIFQAFLALAAGLAVVIGLSLAFSAAINRLVPGWSYRKAAARRGFGSSFVRLGSAFLAAAGGGYVTCWAGKANPLVDVLGLGLVVLALAALSSFESRSRLPVWFQLLQVAILPLGVLAGGLVRLRASGIF
ncbi:MAG: hypothetical protein ACP5FH_06450 [Terracidiphilus sp.]